MSIKLQIFLILLVALAFSCKSPTENEIPILSPDMSQPIATGIYITNSSGPDPIGIWGNPSDGSNATSAAYPLFSSRSVIPNRVELNHPYPNPFIGTCVINFSIPVQSNVLLYVVPARWSGAKSNDINSSAGAVTAAPKRTAIAILTLGQKSAGMYAYNWSARDQNGRSLPAGFYRIYLRVGDLVSWYDVLLYHDISDLPVGLR